MQLRVSDADRHKVAELLREAAGEGRLELDELDARLDATYSAKTYSDLVPITMDLPGHHESPQLPARVPRRQVAPATTQHDSSFALMSETARRGPWLVPETHTAFARMGSVRLDLREATFTVHETTIWANAVMAGIDIVVDEFTRVIVDGLGIMGDFSQQKDKVAARLSEESPVVRVRGLALMSGVNVQRRSRRVPPQS
jgi:hypothetical protein